MKFEITWYLAWEVVSEHGTQVEYSLLEENTYTLRETYPSAILLSDLRHCPGCELILPQIKVDNILQNFAYEF